MKTLTFYHPNKEYVVRNIINDQLHFENINDCLNYIKTTIDKNLDKFDPNPYCVRGLETKYTNIKTELQNTKEIQVVILTFDEYKRTCDKQTKKQILGADGITYTALVDEPPGDWVFVLTHIEYLTTHKLEISVAEKGELNV